MSSEGLSAEERGVLTGLRAGEPGATDRLASLDEASQQRVVAALAQPEGPEPAGGEAAPVTSGSGVVGAAPGGAGLGEVRARPPGRSRLLGPLVVLAALVVVAAGAYLLYGRLFGDDASVVVDSSRREDRDRSLDDADDSAGSGGPSSDGQRQAPVEAKPDGGQGPTESSAVKPAPEPMDEEEPMAEPEPEAAMAEAEGALDPEVLAELEAELLQAELAYAQAEAAAAQAEAHAAEAAAAQDEAAAAQAEADAAELEAVTAELEVQLAYAQAEAAAAQAEEAAAYAAVEELMEEEPMAEEEPTVNPIAGPAVTCCGNAYRSEPGGLITNASDGIIVVGSSQATSFDSYDMVVRQYLASGELDRSFGALVLDVVGGDDSADDRATGVSVDASGRIVVSGYTDANGAGDIVVVRFLASGELDRSFGAAGVVGQDVGGYDVATGVSVDASGRIVVSGYTDANGTGDIVVVRFLASGELDRSFGEVGYVVLDVGGYDGATGLSVDASGRIVVSGYTDANGTGDIVVVRFLASGELDRSFGAAGLVVLDVGSYQEIFPHHYDEATGVSVDASGRIVVSGYTQAAYSVGALVVVRFLASGELDRSFGAAGLVVLNVGDGDDGATDVSVDASGRIVVSGYTDANGTGDIVVVRFLASGELDRSFGEVGLVVLDVGGYDVATHLSVDASGRIVVSGYTDANGVGNIVVVRFLASGELDRSFAAMR